MRLLYLYPSSAKAELERVLSGESPSDRLYGLVELRQRSHIVDIADNRFDGRFGQLVKRLRRYSFNICDKETLGRLGHYDAVVVKDDFSPLISLACRRVGTKLVYLDSIFRLPTDRARQNLLRWNILHADAVVGYSRSQIEEWTDRLRVPPGRMTPLPYTIDLAFYQPYVRLSHPSNSYVLSVGRDPGRDFGTLLDAMDGLNIQLKLVTRPYLLSNVQAGRTWIQVLDHLSYPELFELYAGASVVVVPLKAGTTYASGIRATLEALALARPVIATNSPVLQEYCAEGRGVSYVPPQDCMALRHRILDFFQYPDLRRDVASAGHALVNEAYGMNRFTTKFEALLEDVLR